MKPILMAVFPYAKDLEVMEECDLLSGIFAIRQAIEFREMPNATFQRISDRFKDDLFKPLVTVFHYGGHADGKNIVLPDAAGDMEGLGKMLADLPNLQLVFINGCDSFEQAEILLELKDIAVIVTQGKIRDDVALYFSHQFYTIWTNNNTIQHAFTQAQARVEAKFGAGNEKFYVRERGISLRTLIDPQKPVYCLCGSTEKLAENLHEKFEKEVVADTTIIYKPSRQLASTIADAILAANDPQDANIIIFNAAYQKFLQDVNNPRNFALLREAILKMMPSPIGFHLSLQWAAGNIASTPELFTALLQKQISTYTASLQLLSLSMLNCFLDEYQKLNIKVITTVQKNIIKSFLQSAEPENVLTNSPLLLTTIRKVFDSNEGIQPFIVEYASLKQIFPEENEFINAHQYILGLRTSLLNGQIRQKDVRIECKKMEDTLSRIFSRAGFLAKYKLTSVREISYRKGRVNQAKYEIYRTILDHSMIVEYYPEYFDTPTDTHSVIFARGLDGNDFTTFLSLSPYIIDDSGIKGEPTPNLYFFSHKTGNDYVYRRYDEPNITRTVKQQDTFLLNDLSKKDEKDLEIINFRMTAIKEEMDHFEKLIP